MSIDDNGEASEDENFDEALPLPSALEPADFQEVDYVPTERPRRNQFQAWHRVRKQWVRDKQWVEAVHRVVDGRSAVDRLKYVGLPGVDLLDIRQLIKGICEPQSKELHYIGFDMDAGSGSQSSIELAISQQEMLSHGLVFEESSVRPDDIRTVSVTTTAAYRALKRVAPFDVINLDLTQSVLHDDPKARMSYQGAIRELIGLQVGHRKPWTLLLTTKVDQSDVNRDSLELLLQALEREIAECEEVIAA